MARTFDPFREMDRWFSDVARTPASAAMAMDLYKAGDSFVARLDLPGVDPGSIDVDVDERTLTIRAERGSDSVEGEQRWLVRERPVGTFARQLTLGYGVALDRIAADYRDGVLTLTIPVAEEAKPRKIAVAHTGGATQIEGSVEEDAPTVQN
ncbi:MAG: Hsp20/alpha crystallin family protein [Propionibacterium sp.]|nr:Hsp20/alpha crystallin family protein [Propionibacterium sp.]HMQ39472.1 Hsp20/alpha crystallin family protein [Micropruina sp.]